MKNEKLEKAFEDLKKAIRDIEDAGGSILFELNATNDAHIKGVYYNEYLNGVPPLEWGIFLSKSRGTNNQSRAKNFTTRATKCQEIFSKNFLPLSIARIPTIPLLLECPYKLF